MVRGRVNRRPPAGRGPRLFERQAIRVGIAVAGYLLIGLVAASALRRMDDFQAITAILPAFTFFTAGVVALRARPNSLLPRLLQGSGILAVLWPTDAFAGSALVFTVAVALSNLWVGLISHFWLAFPAGRLNEPAAKAAAFCIYVVVGPLSVLATFDFDPTVHCEECDRDLNLIHTGLPSWLGALYGVLFMSFLLALAVFVSFLLVRRWQGATGPGRRVLAPVVLSGAVAAVSDVALNVTRLAAGPSGNIPGIWGDAPAAYDAVAGVFGLMALPVAGGYLLGVLRTRVTRSTVGELIVALGATTEPREVRDPLAHALGDDSLEVVFWAPALGEYVDAEGRPAELPDASRPRAVTRVQSGGEHLAALIHDPAVLDDEGLIETVAAAARLALERAALQAEVRAQLEAVRESRARIVAAGDEQRRKIERDLHDGAQQRLVSVALTLKLLDRRIDADPAAAKELACAAAREAHAALEELRELAQGLHPQVLTHEGLGPALDSLAERSPVPVEVKEAPPERLPESVEACAYFVCSEALQNVAKYARASRAEVSAVRRNGLLELTVADDGVGGADPAKGSGLRGLVDRVEAAGGSIAVDSPAGQGTRLSATIPLREVETPRP